VSRLAGITETRVACARPVEAFPGTCLNSCWPWCEHEANDWFIQQKRQPMHWIAADLWAAVFNVHREVVRDKGTAISGRSPVTISRIRAGMAAGMARRIRSTEPRGSSRSFLHPTSGIALSRQIAFAGGVRS